MQTVTKQEIHRLTGLIVFRYNRHTHTHAQTLTEVLHFVLKPILLKLFLEKEMCAGYLRGPSVDLLLQ